MRDLNPAPAEVWESGGVANVSMSIIANHGGGWVYRLCPASSNLTEDCFQDGTLPFEGESQWLVDDAGAVLASLPAVRTSQGTTPTGSSWARNPVPMFPGALKPPFAHIRGRGPFHFGVVDTVRVPTIAAGSYVLSLRWDAEQTKQVWSQCGDITIVAPRGGMPAPIVAPPLRDQHAAYRPVSAVVCDGASLGLDVYDCDGWAKVYDSLGGNKWPAVASRACPSLRTDPCGCNSNVWGFFLRCTAKRDLLRLTEIYLLGSEVEGDLPAEIGGLNALVVLSIVESHLRGPLPDVFHRLIALEMLWLDNNVQLSGAVPPSLTQIGGQLTVLELSRSNFSGSLPVLPYATIPDCTLGGLVFDCPLPPGSDSSCGARCH